MPYDFKDITSANAYAEAEANGCTVKLPAPNQLFVDIDSEDGAMWFCLNIGKVSEQVGVVDTERHPSRSGTPLHEHVTVTLAREVTEMERILLQAVLGSDRKREALSWVRLVNNDPNPTLFFEKKPLQLPAHVESAANSIWEQGDYPF